MLAPHAPLLAAHAPAHAALLAAHTATHLKRIDPAAGIHRQHKISNWIHLDDDMFRSFFLRGNQHHLIFDDVGKVEVAQQESQRRTQRDARDAFCQGRFKIKSGILKSLHVDFYWNALRILNLGNDIANRRLCKFKALHLLVECVKNLLLGTAGFIQIDRLVFFPFFCQFSPSLRTGIFNRRFVRKRNVGHIRKV